MSTNAPTKSKLIKNVGYEHYRVSLGDTLLSLECGQATYLPNSLAKKILADQFPHIVEIPSTDDSILIYEKAGDKVVFPMTHAVEKNGQETFAVSAEVANHKIQDVIDTLAANEAEDD